MMPIDFDLLGAEPRLLLEAELAPIQGTRFQPTGFPDLGAATYQHPNGDAMLLVESAQSVANRLEEVCWDHAADDWIGVLTGLPYVRVVKEDGQILTASVLEAHRMNSVYIVNADGFDRIREDIGFVEKEPFRPKEQLFPVLLRYDPGSLLHGVFLEKVGGVVRTPRVISGFIEARKVLVAASGGVKVDRVQPSKGGEGRTAKEGYGNVPFARDEFVAEQITAFFNLDLLQIRGFGLGENAERLLIALALFKIRRLLRTGLRLRTACDLEAKEPVVTRPDGFVVPSEKDLEKALSGMITAVKDEGLFAEPAVTTVTYRS